MALLTKDQIEQAVKQSNKDMHDKYFSDEVEGLQEPRIYDSTKDYPNYCCLCGEKFIKVGGTCSGKHMFYPIVPTEPYKHAMEVFEPLSWTQKLLAEPLLYRFKRIVKLLID